MAAAVTGPEPHHHRSTVKTPHKPFKSRHATKNARRPEKRASLGNDNEKGVRRTPHQTVMSKLDRRNQAKQKRLAQHKERERALNVFAGKSGAPRIVAVVPVCDGLEEICAGEDTVLNLLSGTGIDRYVGMKMGIVRQYIDRFKQNIQFLLPKRGLVEALNACRVADFVIFMVWRTEEVDELGETILKAVESQGISNVLFVAPAMNEPKNPATRANKRKAMALLSPYLSRYLSRREKIQCFDSPSDCSNIMRSLCTSTPKGVNWREDRSWMLVENVSWAEGGSASDSTKNRGVTAVTGVIRGQPLKSDRLVQLGDWGSFQIDKIVAAPLQAKGKTSVQGMDVDDSAGQVVLDTPTIGQDDPAALAPEEVAMEDADSMASESHQRKGVLLDDHHYFSDGDEDDYTPPRPKKLPKGTSKYQSAWFLGDVSDSGSDLEDVEENEDETISVGGASGTRDTGDMPYRTLDDEEMADAGPSEYAQSEMFLDPSPEEEAQQLADYRSSRKKAEQEDLEFPDEIELHPGVSAKERLTRYRGLKNFKTSNWETEEDRPYEPSEWRRLLEISDYKGAKSRVVREALVGGVQPGTRVTIYIKDVPSALSQTYSPRSPLTLFSLLRHEQKWTAVHYSIKLSTHLEGPIKSKEELVVQCGPRRFAINPLFSQNGNTPNDVHKFDRYLHPGRTAVASFLGPLTWGSLPVLFFKKAPDSKSSLELVATGTSLPPNTNRVIAKRVILTGHPFKIHRKLVTVRYMFFNAEDVAWFKALQLWTKRGRSGFIKESLGTHGYFKATFDGRINPMDAVGMSLYKRVWPRSAKMWSEEQNEEPPVLVDA
ncbi:hypothetical protein BDY21DRAFT_279923 [Lineolata rhizophorae]|uniref:Bms1-type G domain-containing protein n=1 Tax=Lineolata rhizophorae TaxID=578093 RepID=A0A6A6P9V1_9PEZI|nr:hypothetical protein BDY21DRAFT_279923 [Lineolata rhizophorae]